MDSCFRQLLIQMERNSKHVWKNYESMYVCVYIYILLYNIYIYIITFIKQSKRNEGSEVVNRSSLVCNLLGGLSSLKIDATAS